MTVIQVLPPAPPRRGVSFDRWQFAGRTARASSARSGISHADFASMHVHRHSAGAPHRNDYSWAHNDATVREVLAAMLSKSLYVRIQPTLEDIRFADKLFETKGQRLFERFHKYWLRHRVVPSWYGVESMRPYDQAKLAGGLSKFFLGILYRTTRLKLESVTVAEAMQCTPQVVRRVLDKMHHVAKDLAAGTCRFPKRTVADETAKQEHLAKYLPKPPKKPMKQPVFVPNPTGLCMCNCGQMTERIKQNEKWKGRIKGEFSMFCPGHVSRVKKPTGRPKKAAVAA